MAPIDKDPNQPPVKEPERDKPPVNIDPDDAQIDEPKDDAFKKGDQPANKRGS